jgi:hypothetical protein
MGLPGTYLAPAYFAEKLEPARQANLYFPLVMPPFFGAAGGCFGGLVPFAPFFSLETVDLYVPDFDGMVFLLLPSC